MKTYTIPQVWRAWGTVMIKATNLKAAVKKAYSGPIPKHGEYVDDSQQIDWEGLEIHNDLPEKDKEFIRNNQNGISKFNVSGGVS